MKILSWKSGAVGLIRNCYNGSCKVKEFCRLESWSSFDIRRITGKVLLSRCTVLEVTFFPSTLGVSKALGHFVRFVVEVFKCWKELIAPGKWCWWRFCWS
ncbi:hypothetical protein V6N13_114105 [Hibiscus sabdariffa]